jgi:hypothetical protein
MGQWLIHAKEKAVPSQLPAAAGDGLSYLMDRPFPFAGAGDLFIAGNVVCRMGADGAPLASALLRRHRDVIPWQGLIAEMEAKASAAQPKP